MSETDPSEMALALRLAEALRPHSRAEHDHHGRLEWRPVSGGGFEVRIGIGGRVRIVFPENKSDA